MVRMNFQVDSPAAWAAEYHNCTLLNRNVSVEKHLLESADATCQLLRSCSEETLEKLCKLITRNGLGGRSVFSATGTLEHVPALLPPQGVLKVLACVKDVGHDTCTMPTAWYHDGTGILHLEEHSAKVPVKFVVAQLEAMDETKGLAWLQAMKVTSDSQGSGDSDFDIYFDSDFDSDSDSEFDMYRQSKDDAALFDQELAKTALEVGQITALPKVLRILGHWKLGMPQILLDALVASHRMDLMQLMELTPEHSLSDTFSGVKALDAFLDDASDLCFVSLALNLAQNLEELKVSCFRCNDFAKVPSAKAWNHLSSQIAKAKIQFLDVDHFIVTDPGLVVHHSKSLKSLSLTKDQITTIPKKVFSGLPNLETLDLENNQIITLSKEAFSGLSKLEALDLGSNKLTTLPKDVFSGLSKLEGLNLQGNHLKEDDIPGLSNLTARGVYVGVWGKIPLCQEDIELSWKKKTKSSLLISSPQNTEVHPQWRRFISGVSPPLAWCTIWILDATPISSISSIPSFIDDSFIISFSQFYSVNHIFTHFSCFQTQIPVSLLSVLHQDCEMKTSVCRCLLYVMIHQVPRIAWG